QKEVLAFPEDKKRRSKKDYVLPPIRCLREPDFSKGGDISAEIRQTSQKLVDTLKSFGVETTLIGVSRGPSVTRYELQPAPGVKISKITSLADDIALNLASSGVRIEAPIPNKSAVGIEVPNQTRASVTLREIIASSEFQSSRSKLNVALGKDITGHVNCTDLAKMPHLLIAGTTGSGKSVCLNCMVCSILYNASPDDVKLLMIDPKQVEFSVYNGIPHLLVPVISDVRKAAGSLAWAVGEMENRYKLFSQCGVRDIKGFNKYIIGRPEYEHMPQIVIFIDELNDLMMISPKEVEDSICRLAQKARAAGMHLVVATQRPSVDVITGIIKANIPSRLSLSVSSQVDSRTILDAVGAEKLLGNGDMLFSPIGNSKPVRIQGAYVSEEEIENIVDFIKAQAEVEYDDEIMEEIERQATAEKKKNALASAGDDAEDGGDVMIDAAIEVVVETQQASTTLLQRKLRLGYARAARIMDELEQRGVVGPSEGSKPRKVLMTKSQLAEKQASKDYGDGGDINSFDILSD
ncbi:MAG: DNA translocase FtsK, partial [Clostridia bacterium]|nr:DNA translocase FtsK [Clostridia bacterium]